MSIIFIPLHFDIGHKVSQRNEEKSHLIHKMFSKVLHFSDNKTKFYVQCGEKAAYTG